MGADERESMRNATTVQEVAIAVRRISPPGRGEFERRYLSAPGDPVILTDVVTRWPAFRKWTFQFLSSLFGDRQIIVGDQLFEPQKAFHMSLRTFLSYCENPTLFADQFSGLALYFGLQPFCLDSPLLSDFIWPEECDNLYAHLGDEVFDWYLRQFGVLLIGPSATITPDHVDLFGTHAWLAQLYGSKRFLFWAPESERADNALPTHDNSPTHEAVVNAGDIIVFPQGWRHSVVSLSSSISLSFNFVNRTNYGAHLIEIFRDLPRWSRRINTPALRKALGITWRAESELPQTAHVSE